MIVTSEIFLLIQSIGWILGDAVIQNSAPYVGEDKQNVTHIAGSRKQTDIKLSLSIFLDVHNTNGISGLPIPTAPTSDSDIGIKAAIGVGVASAALAAVVGGTSILAAGGEEVVAAEDVVITMVEFSSNLQPGSNNYKDTSLSEHNGNNPEASLSQPSNELSPSRNYESNRGTRDGQWPLLNNPLTNGAFSDISSETDITSDLDSLTELSHDTEPVVSDVENSEIADIDSYGEETDFDADDEADTQTDGEESNSDSNVDEEDIDASNRESPGIVEAESNEILSEEVFDGGEIISNEDNILHDLRSVEENPAEELQVMAQESELSDVSSEEHLTSEGGEYIVGDEGLFEESIATESDTIEEEIEPNAYGRANSLVMRSVREVGADLHSLQFNLNWIMESVQDYGVIVTNNVMVETGLEGTIEDLLEGISTKIRELIPLVEEAQESIRTVGDILKDTALSAGDKSSMLTEFNQMNQELNAVYETPLAPEE